MSQKELLPQFAEEDLPALAAEMKIGLLATVDPQGRPHVTMLSTLMACGPKQLCFGQFTEGLSKENIRRNPRTGFLIMSLDRHEWRGKATYTHSARDGKEYDRYNQVPMFRYNAYFGVHTVYYLDLVGQTGKAALAMNRVVPAAIGTLIGRSLARKPGRETALNTWTQAFLNKLDNLKFLAYVGGDGYPVIFPAIQAQCLDRQHLVFSMGAYGEEIAALPSGVSLALFGMALSMEDVLLRGDYLGVRRVGGVPMGVLRVDWVYNPMPPVPGQVYPPAALAALKEF